jgi:choline dehydrogenase-like flavoprotein
MPDYDVFDVIVVGAGTAGTILASRIAENGINPSTGDRLRVALFEGGAYYTRYFEGKEVGGPIRPGVGDPWRRRLVTNMRQDESLVRQWHYDGFNVKAVGGCSLHWGSHAFLPNARDFHNWNRETDVGWTQEAFKEAFDEAITMYHVEPLPAPQGRGGGEDADEGGPRPLTRAGRMFAAAADTLGVKYNQPQDPRDRTIRGEARTNCILCGYCGRGHYCKYDSKRNGLWYLELIGEPNGVQTIPDAEVHHVILEKRGRTPVATGIAYTRDGRRREARAPRVIVACGTNGTPLVLYQSGYGPKDVLGNRLVVQNENVGRHLSGDIAGLDILMSFGEDIHVGAGGGCNAVLHQEEDGYRNVLTLSGIGAISYTNRYPDLMALLPVAPDFGREHKAFMKSLTRRVGVIGFGMKGLKWGGGRISPRGEHLYRRDDPRILGIFQKHWPTAQEIVRRLDPRPLKVDDPGPKSFNVYHEVGTCRAGASRRNSVVTPDFDSHDVDGLIIGSGAVIPAGNHTLSHMPIVAASCYGWRRIVANHFSRGAVPLAL